MNKKTAIITTGYFPVPAVMGGAVESLVENIVKENEIQGKIELSIFSAYHPKATEESKVYKKTNFIFVKTPIIIRFIDKLVYKVAGTIFKKKKTLSYRYIFQRLYYILKVAKKINNEDYDLIIFENHPLLLNVLKLYNNKEKYKDKYYLHLHNDISKCFGCYQELKECKKIIGISNYINNRLMTYLNETDVKDKYYVLRNRIDREGFVKTYDEQELTRIKNQYSINKETFVILFAGRLSPEKGVKELLLACKELEIDNYKLLIVGSYYFESGMVGEYEIELKKIIKGMQNHIVFTGYVPYTDIPKYYSIADVVVAPAIWDDPAPLAVIEAITAGKPLITTNSGGIPEYVEPDYGIMLERDEKLIKNIRESIVLLYESNDKRNQLAENAKKHADNWDKKSYYDDLCKYID